jgi:predicted lipid-binding transport protein (Tim44 family)
MYRPQTQASILAPSAIGAAAESVQTAARPQPQEDPMAGPHPTQTDPAAPPRRAAGGLAGMLPAGAPGMFLLLGLLVVLWVLAGLTLGYAGVILGALLATLLVFVYLMLITRE